LGDATIDDMEFVPEPFLGLAKFPAQVGDVLTAKVLHLDPFQVVPDTFGWVELGSIGGGKCSSCIRAAAPWAK
jgi:hypothetical protein